MMCCDFSFSKEFGFPKYRGKNAPKSPMLSYGRVFGPLRNRTIHTSNMTAWREGHPCQLWRPSVIRTPRDLQKIEKCLQKPTKNNHFNPGPVGHTNTKNTPKRGQSDVILEVSASKIRRLSYSRKTLHTHTHLQLLHDVTGFCVWVERAVFTSCVSMGAIYGLFNSFLFHIIMQCHEIWHTHILKSLGFNEPTHGNIRHC